MDVAELLEAVGGYAHKSTLVRVGARDVDLTRAVRSGRVSRLRRGWYTSRDPHGRRGRAIRVGGRLTGLSAIAEWGGWVLRDPILHVSVPRNAARLRAAGRSVRIHWESPDVGDRGTVASVGLVDALIRVVLDEDLETAVAALDWALHTGRLEQIDFEELVLLLPRRHRGVRHGVDSLCESLPESLARTRLRLAGHSTVSQVRLESDERIDLAIDGVVGLETDGEKFHRDRFERDRRKDLAIVMAGYRPLRVPAVMVFHEWEVVLRAIELLLDNRGRPG